MVSKICGLLSGACLLLAAQTCLAEDQWAGPIGTFLGPKAKTELAALGEKGRTAFKKALIACGLYVDEPYNAKHEGECKLAFKVFTVEFSNEHSAISSLFDNAIIMTGITQASAELAKRQGQREPPHGNSAKGDITDLQRIYRDTMNGASVVTTSPVRPSNINQILQKQGTKLVQ